MVWPCFPKGDSESRRTVIDWRSIFIRLRRVIDRFIILSSFERYFNNPIIFNRHVKIASVVPCVPNAGNVDYRSPLTFFSRSPKSLSQHQNLFGNTRFIRTLLRVIPPSYRYWICPLRTIYFRSYIIFFFLPEHI